MIYLEVQKNYSIKTIGSYKIDVEEFLCYLDKEHLDLVNVKYNDIHMYLKNLSDKQNSNATISRKISALRGLYKYLIKQDLIKQNPFYLVSLPKKEKKLPRFFYYNELELLFDVPDLKTPLGQRDRLILEMLYATGVRVSELVNIEIKDISDKEIRVLGKGDKERIVRFGRYALEILNLYLNDGYKKLNTKNINKIFLNNKGTALTTRGVKYILDNIIKKTSIDKNISPHMLRHTFATHLLNEGCDITSVSELLGHASLSATAIYTHVTSDRLKEVYYHTHPRAKK